MASGLGAHSLQCGPVHLLLPCSQSPFQPLLLGLLSLQHQVGTCSGLTFCIQYMQPVVIVMTGLVPTVLCELLYWLQERLCVFLLGKL